MKVNKIIKIKGKPKKIIETDVFGFVAVLMTKTKNGELIDKIILFTINGEKIRSLKLEKNKKIVEITKQNRWLTDLIL